MIDAVRLGSRMLVLCIVACASSACGSGGPKPLPDLSGAEMMIKQKLRRCHADVVSDPSEETWARYARTLHVHGMHEHAEQAYVAAAAAAGGERAFEHLHLAGYAVSGLHPERAWQYFVRAFALRDDYEPTHLGAAMLAEVLDKPDEARQHYQRAAALRPSSHAHLGLGRIALSAGDAKSAIKHLLRAVKLDSTHRQVYEAMARAYARLGRVSESRKAASRAGDLSAATSSPDELMAKVMAEDVSYRGFETRALALLDSTPIDPRARSVHHIERLEQALAEIDQARLARPDYTPARHFRALILGRLGRIDGAIDEFEAVLSVRPRDVEAHFGLARLLRSEHREADARRHVDAALAERPTHRGSLILRAAILLSADEREAAERDLKALLKVDPSNVWARRQLQR